MIEVTHLSRSMVYGLTAVSFFAVLSFISTLALLVNLSIRFSRWKMSFHSFLQENEVTLLIYNLLLADIQTSIGFSINIFWVAHGLIRGPSSPCFAQGLFISVGDVGNSLWVVTIAVHSVMIIIWRQRPSPLAFGLLVMAIWLFDIFLLVVGLSMHSYDFYTPTGSWCWINAKYASDRLWLHYFWIFLSEFGTVALYSLSYLHIRRHFRTVPPSTIGSSQHDAIARAGRYMVIYPLVHVVSTIPLASARMAALTGIEISPILYCVAGAFFTSCGWLDVLVYSSTRKDIWMIQSKLKKGEDDNLALAQAIGDVSKSTNPRPADSEVKGAYTTTVWASSDRSEGERSFFTDSAENLVGDIRMQTVVEVSREAA